jgi:hypothetical protein
MTGLTTLDRAWGEINALGGSADPDDFAGRERNNTVREALAILEKHGARDPLTVRHYHVAGTTVGKHIDTCAACGNDLRSDIHFRVGE